MVRQSADGGFPTSLGPSRSASPMLLPSLSCLELGRERGPRRHDEPVNTMPTQLATPPRLEASARATLLANHLTMDFRLRPTAVLVFRLRASNGLPSNEGQPHSG